METRHSEIIRHQTLIRIVFFFEGNYNNEKRETRFEHKPGDLPGSTTLNRRFNSINSRVRLRIK